MTAAVLTPIVLRNGARIEDALEMAVEFVEHDGSYQSYDLAPVEQDDVLTEPDIRVANAMIARMSARVIADIYSRAQSSMPPSHRFRRPLHSRRPRMRSPGGLSRS